MTAQVFRFVSLLFTALVLGLAFCQVLEMPTKLMLAPGDYLLVQRLYQTFGPVASIIEPGAILTTAAAAYLLRRRRLAFGFTVAGALLLAGALVVWFAVVAPVNPHWAATDPTAVPDGFQALRARWEYGHLAHASLVFAAFMALLVSVLAETPGGRAAGRQRSGSWRGAA